MKYDLKVAEALEGVNDAIVDIINAFKREKPVQNYPRSAFFVYDWDIDTTYKINEDLTIEVIDGYGGEDGIVCIQDNEHANRWMVCDYWDEEHSSMISGHYVPIFGFNKETFELYPYINDCENLHWIDTPSA